MMKFFEEILSQKFKTGYSVCGDYCLCERRQDSTVYVVCDGVGSGVYANIAAIACAERIMELLRLGVSSRAAAEMVAASMNRARKEEVPFSAFSLCSILPDGSFTVYTYESPNPILLQNGSASVLNPRFYTAEYEVIGESTGMLYMGDALMLFSDGVSQAGLGHGYGMGIGSDGVAAYINRIYKPGIARSLPEEITDMCAGLSDGKNEDDTTLTMLLCREAKQCTILTGPPSKAFKDKKFVEDFMNFPGQKAICGSTTSDIVARETKRPIKMLTKGNSLGTMPEYEIEGVDITTEGAIVLNQVYNILEEPLEAFKENSVVEKLCIMLRESDVIHLMIGNAINDAHEGVLFKQVGVRVRRSAVELITEKLRGMGKLVTERYY